MCRAPHSPATLLCRGPALSMSGPGRSPQRSLCRGPCSALSRCSLCGAPAVLVSGPGALCVGARRSLCRPQLRPACHPSGCGPPASIHVPPTRSAGPQLRSACHPSSPVRSLFPGENPKPHFLGENHESSMFLGSWNIMIFCSCASQSYHCHGVLFLVFSCILQWSEWSGAPSH